MTATIPADALTRAESIIGGTGDSLPSPREIVPEISPEISAVILRGMSINSEQRYSDAKEMQKALREAYSQIKQQTAAEASALDGAETLVLPEVKAAVPSGSVSGGQSDPRIFSQQDVDGMFSKAQEPPPVTLTAEILAGEAETPVISAELWQGETQGFTHDEIRRSTIDEDAFKERGFDPEATVPWVGFDAGNGSGMPPPYIDDEPERETRASFDAPAAAPVVQSEPVEKTAPIRPVSKPLEPGEVKPSSGWGLRLVGIAAILCLLVAGVGAVGWYAVTAKLINIPGLEQTGGQATQEKNAGSTEGQDTGDQISSAATEAATSDPAEKEAQNDSGPTGGNEDRSSAEASAPDTGSNSGANTGANAGDRKGNPPARTAAKKTDGKPAKPARATKQGSKIDIMQ